jgi:hypothetical protein
MVRHRSNERGPTQSAPPRNELHKKTTTFLTSTAIAITVAGWTGAPAQAADADTASLDALANVSRASSSGATDVLGGLAPVDTEGGGSSVVDATVGDVDVLVPRDPSDPMHLESGDVSLAITLPFSGQSADAERLTRGLVSYDNHNDSTTAVGVKADGSVQMTTTVESGAAPAEFSYGLDVPESATLSTTAEGGVVIRDSDGAYLASVAPAWAIDAQGKEVPSRYRIEGTTLIQEVDHGDRGVAYPVVADPWLCFALINSTSWSGSTLRVYPTDYGRWGASVARSAAWDEVKAKTPGTRENTSSMTDQFLCHYDARPLTSTKASWNLDLNRPYVNYAWLLARGCNN